jgi:hypothetical protein
MHYSLPNQQDSKDSTAFFVLIPQYNGAADWKNSTFPDLRFPSDVKQPSYFPLTTVLLSAADSAMHFRRIICAFKGKECTDCLLQSQCVYAYVFETPIPADAQIMRKYTAAPHIDIMKHIDIIEN